MLTILTKPKVRDILLANLGHVFATNNFVEKPAKTLQFQQHFQGGMQSCTFTITEHDGTFLIDISLGIRIDIVENFVNQFTLTLKEYHANTHTIYISYGKFIGKSYFYFKVKSEGELVQVCKDIKHFLEQRAFPFLAKNSNIESLNTLINTAPEELSLFICNPAYRALKGVLIAKMCQHKDFDELAKVYRAMIEKSSFRDKMMPNYLLLIKHLYLVSFN